MSRLLDARQGFRLPIVLAGAMLASSRRTATRWFRAAGFADDWDRFYDLLGSIGRLAGSLMMPLLALLVRRFDPGPKDFALFMVEGIGGPHRSHRVLSELPPHHQPPHTLHHS